MPYSEQHVAAIRAAAARGDQGAVLAAAQLDREAQLQSPATVEAGTRFQPPQTPRVNGREITVDVTQLR